MLKKTSPFLSRASSSPYARSSLWLSLLVSGLLLSGCGGAPKRFTPSPIAPLKLEEFRGLKQRIVVKKIRRLPEADALIKELNLEGIELGLTQYAADELVRSRYVDVLERASLDQVKSSIMQESESDESEFFDQKTTAKKGKFLGAELVLLGNIDRIEPNVSKQQASLKIPYLGSLKATVDRSAVQVSLRIVQVETGKVLAAATGRGEIKTTGLGLEVNKLPESGEFKLDMTKKTPLGHCFLLAINQAIEALAKELYTVPWDCKIQRAKGKRVFAGCGLNLNVRKGLKMQLIHRGEAINDDEGNLLGYEEEEDGEVQIVSVQKKLSVGKHDGKTPAKKGDILRFMPPRQ